MKITKSSSSFEDSSHLGYATMSVGRWFPVFQRTVVSSLSVKQSCVPRSLKLSAIMLQEFRVSQLHNLVGEKIKNVQQHT